jgi:hypothetical protein
MAIGSRISRQKLIFPIFLIPHPKLIKRQIINILMADGLRYYELRNFLKYAQYINNILIY